jgi:hypothetical protein
MAGQHQVIKPAKPSSDTQISEMVAKNERAEEQVEYSHVSIGSKNWKNLLCHCEASGGEAARAE